MQVVFRRRDVALRFGFQRLTETLMLHIREKAHRSGMLALSHQMEVSHGFSTSVSRGATLSSFNPPILPEDFAPIQLPIDIRRHTVFTSNSYLASTSIEKSQDDNTHP